MGELCDHREVHWPVEASACWSENKSRRSFSVSMKDCKNSPSTVLGRWHVSLHPREEMMIMVDNSFSESTVIAVWLLKSLNRKFKAVHGLTLVFSYIDPSQNDNLTPFRLESLMTICWWNYMLINILLQRVISVWSLRNDFSHFIGDSCLVWNMRHYEIADLGLRAWLLAGPH